MFKDSKKKPGNGPAGESPPLGDIMTLPRRKY
jgi:hypothetical protein